MHTQFMHTRAHTHTYTTHTHSRTQHMLIMDIQFKAITDHSTAEPLRTLHTTVDTETTVPYVAALEAGKISVYSEQYKCSWTTPGTNWKKNLWCLGEVNNQIIIVV